MPPILRITTSTEGTATVPNSPANSTTVPQPQPKAANVRRGLLWTTAVLVLCGVGFVTWDEVLKDRFVAKRFGVVVPGAVFRSGQISKWMLEPTVREHDIQAIVDINGLEPGLPGQAEEVALAERLGLEHYRFQLAGDGTGDIRRYADAVETLARCHRAGKPVLVHCAAGTQRTGGVVSFYRVLVLKHSPEQVVADLLPYGWDPVEDKLLLDYCNGHMAELAALLVERGVIDEVPSPLPVLRM
jgi:protein-tyrosine phosphatase